MHIKEVRAMPSETLRSELAGAYKEHFNLRFQRAIQQLSDTTALRKTRKKIARIKTVLRERELAQQAQR